MACASGGSPPCGFGGRRTHRIHEVRPGERERPPHDFVIDGSDVEDANQTFHTVAGERCAAGFLEQIEDRAGDASPVLPAEMPAVCIGGNAASRAAEHAQNRRLVVRLWRLRQQIEVTLNEPRDRRTSGSRVALGAANHLFIDAERELRHIVI